MNVLIVTAMYPPIRTGTSFYSRNLARALANRGHRVRVITVGNRDAIDRSDEHDVVRLRALRFPLKSHFKHLSLTSVFPQSYVRTVRVAREFETDVILLVNHYLDIAFPAVLAARLTGVALVCSVGTQLQSPHPFRHRVLNFFDRLICGRMIFPSCTRLVAWDDQILCYLRDVHGERVIEKTRIVNFGVNGDANALAAREHDYSLHNQVIGVGSVIEQRDYTALVHAFKLVSGEFPRLRLKVIGHVYLDSAVRLAAELGVADRVTFVGERSHDEVLAELQKSDAYFVSLTGRYTGIGTATLEAMLIGVPTIVNAYPGILGRAHLEDMRNMALLQGLSPEAIAGRLRALLSDAGLRASIGRNGRQFVLEQMSWEKVAGDMEVVLQDAADRRNATPAGVPPP